MKYTGRSRCREGLRFNGCGRGLTRHQSKWSLTAPSGGHRRETVFPWPCCPGVCFPGGSGEALLRSAAPIATWAGSSPEQPRQHRSAAGGAGVGCAAASLMLRYTGQHLLDVLTASGVAGLAAGAAGDGTAHEVFALSEGVDGRESDDPRMDTRMAVNVYRCAAPRVPHSNLANTPGGIKWVAGRIPGCGSAPGPAGVLVSNRGQLPRRADG